MEEKDFTVYEAGFLLNPTLSADETTDFVASLRAKVEGAGGEYVAHESPKEIALQYEMSREINNKKTWFSGAIFGWLKFKMEPKDISIIEALLKADEKIIRYLLIKTVAENTLFGNKLAAPKKRREKKDKDDSSEEEEVAEVINEEEVDKKIDEMVLES